MNSTLPLHSMIKTVIDGAKMKLAAAEEADEANNKDDKAGKLLRYEKKEHGHVPSVTEEQAEKTASLTDPIYIEKLASAVDFIAENLHDIEETGPVGQALAKLAAKDGSPRGAGKGPGSLELNKPTGGTQPYKKDKPKTEDAAASQAGAPLSTGENGKGKTQLDNNMHTAPGQNSGSVPSATYPAKGPLVNSGKAKTAAEAATEHILLKLAGEDVSPANISAKGGSNPLAGKGQLSSFDAGQAPPSASGGPTSGFGNEGRRLIASNTAATDYTKKDAKKPVKPQLKTVLEEPALNKATDSKVHENLRNADKGGVKIAAVRDHMTKIAAGGCTCGGKGECEFDLLKEAAKRAGGKDKAANTMNPASYGASSGPGMSGGAGAGGGGGGMGAMAAGGMGADGCTCANAGECRVCKLKAALAEAQAQAMGGAPIPGGASIAAGGGAPVAGAGVEKDSMGTTY